MEDDRDPFLEDDDSASAGVDTQNTQCGTRVNNNENRENQTSPILNSTSSNASCINAGRRKGRIRRSGIFQETHLSLSLEPKLENLRLPSNILAEGLSLSQEIQTNFIEPKTPLHIRIENNSPQPCTSDVQSDEDIFASPAGDEHLNPSALNALFDQPEPADLSWSMITPSANQASNTSWSNLNTEERRVLLPSDGSNLVVKPRALFSPDANDTADSHSLNISSDAGCVHPLKGLTADKTPNYRGRKNSLVSAVPVESPLATCITADDSFYDTPGLKTRQKCLEASTGSPILSGSNEFSKSIRVDKGEEDLFGNEEECLGILPHSQTNEAQDPKIAESTPHAGYRKKTNSDELIHPVTPLRKDLKHGESFLQDISVTALEEVCQAQELKDQALLSTPEKQSETKRKRLLFSSNVSVQNDVKGIFKTPEAKCKEKQKDSAQENSNDNYIPDDSFMEHLAAMNTSIFTDNVQPATKMQSIKTSLSKIKKFSYSAGGKDGSSVSKTFNSSEPKTLMKEILSSVIVMETAPAFTAKTKSIKSNGDLVVFSQMQEEIKNEDSVEICHKIQNSSLPVPPRAALRENKPESTNAVTVSSLLSPCEGFQTGQGKQVALSKEALSKGLNLFKDCMEAVDTPNTPSVSDASESKMLETNLSDDLAAEEIKQLLQLVSAGEEFNPWHDSEISPKPTKQENFIGHVDQGRRNNPVKENKVDASSLGGGFSTAGGKSIYITDENLARAEKFLLEPDPASTNCDENSKTSHKNLQEEKNTNLDEKGRKCEQNEIQTASDVPGSISRKRRLGEAPNASSFVVPMKKTCLEIPDAVPSSHQTGNCSDSAMSRRNLQEDILCVSETIIETHSKPLVNISQEAMNVVNGLIFNSSYKRKEAPSTSRSQIGFSTASGGTVNISKHAVDKAKKLFDDLPADFEMESSEYISVEVLTSETKIPNSVKTSNSACDHAANVQQKESNLVESISNCAEQIETTLVGFSTAGGKKVNVSEKAKAQVKNLFNDLSEPDTKLESKTSIPKLRRSLGSVNKLGIQSTSKPHTPVPLSTDCVQNNGSFATPIEKLNSRPSHHKVRRSLGSGSKQGIQPLSRAQSTVHHNVDSSIVNGSFATASGKSDSVSKQTPCRVRNISEGISRDCVLTSRSSNSDEISKSAKQLPVDVAGFSTAGGRTVQISAEALNRVRNLFDDLPSDSPDMGAKPSLAKKPSVDMTGFSTAGGKSVAISEETLKRASNLFHDLPSEMANSNAKSGSAKSSVDMAGFSTAGGKSVAISEETLKRASNLFHDLPLEMANSNAKSGSAKSSVDMAGFSTAGGKSVAISEEALNRARNLLDDVPSEMANSNAKSTSAKKPSVDMVGFSTAGGKSVAISGEALSRARNLFDDLPSEMANSNAKSGSAKSSVDMVGFSTAGGKSVAISEEALNRARNLLDDLPSETANPNVKSSSAKSSVDMAGFSTAGGRAVQISKEALNKARNLFDDPTSLVVNGNMENDSGVFLSRNDSHTDSLRSKKECAINQCSFPASAISLNSAENSSLTQEISESTAAILADDGFDLPRSGETEISQQTISTSPSMVTDRSGGLKPVISSASHDEVYPSEPSSPILSKSLNAASRKRPRRGRLSLSTNPASKVSPTSESQSTASFQDHPRRARLSLPSTVSAVNLAPSHTVASSEHSVPNVLKRPPLEEIASVANTTNDISSSKLPPSRKLFASDSDLSPAKLNTPNSKLNLTGPSVAERNLSADVTPVIPVSRPHQNPLIKKAFEKSKNLATQSSGFKTPYKKSSTDQPKRSPSSPLQNPPEAKRLKTSTNLYISHVYSSHGLEKLNPRYLRPEVAEMRRRAALEQKQVVDDYVEHKGELVRPCLGSWLSQKLDAKACGNLLEMSAMGTPSSSLPSELSRNGVRSSSLSITSENAANFRFSAWEYYSEDMCRENVTGIPAGDGALLVLDSKGFIGLEEFQRAFLASPGVDPSLVPLGWIKNHYRWLVWKLAALECRFPCQLGGRCFSPHVLMLQLKYRYDREIDRCERPALRRIFEHDDSAAKRMVLCVASIFKREDVSVGIELELTDGWYSVVTSIDQDMQFRVKKGTIKIGTKLIMHNAELINCSDGCFPLQVRDDVRLKLCSNSTRRARWYAKLGFQDNPGPINLPLNSIISSGGLVSCVTAYVARVYPPVFMEKTTERTVVRCQRAESKEVARRERTREQLADKVYSQVQAELQKEQTKHKTSAKKFSLKHVESITSGEELSNILENASDPMSVQSVLTEEQKRIVANYQRVKQDELRGELEARVRLRLSENANHERQITPILKVRLFDSVNGNRCCAILSVWRPSEDMTLMFKEGQKLSIFSAVANGVRRGELQLSANRSTRYNCDNTAETNSSLIRCVSPLASLALQGFLPPFGEIDIVGIVIRISAAPQTSDNPTPFQTAYVSDSQQNIVCIMFWGGIKEFGMDDLIVPHSFIAASNLQCRGKPIVKAVPCVFASELSLFTTNPRQQYLQTAQQELRRSVPADLKIFCQACEDKLDNLLSQKLSPAASLKTPDSMPSVSKLVEENNVKLNVLNEDSRSINSTTAVKAQHKLSMEKQLKTPTNTHSPALEKRLASLERYGDAVQISPIFISQPRRSLRQDFKAPRRTDSPSIE